VLAEPIRMDAGSLIHAFPLMKTRPVQQHVLWPVTMVIWSAQEKSTKRDVNMEHIANTMIQPPSVGQAAKIPACGALRMNGFAPVKITIVDAMKRVLAL